VTFEEKATSSASNSRLRKSKNEGTNNHEAEEDEAEHTDFYCIHSLLGRGGFSSTGLGEEGA